MSSQRPSFAKRDREAKLRDKAKAKEERRQQRANSPGGGGPPIDFDALVTYTESVDPTLPPANTPGASDDRSDRSDRSDR